MLDESTLFAGLAVVLIAAGLAAFLSDRYLVAGVCMLAVSFTIYVRETRR